MKNIILILVGKSIIFLSKILNLGSGSTWPGHIALNLNPNFIKETLRSHIPSGKLKIVVIAGTNGKTTTGKLISEILKANKKRVLHNAAGANLLNGLASTLIKGSSLPRPGLAKLNCDYLIFECDENAFPDIIEQTNPHYVVCLNLFRDQLDRYGEIDSVAKKWQKAINLLSGKTTLILNADDPQVSYLAGFSKTKQLFFGLDEAGSKETKHGADSIYCPKCSSKLVYKNVFFSHLGDWNCPACLLTRPKLNSSNLSSAPFSGSYNRYNALAASLFAKTEGISDSIVASALASFAPAFGRGEKIIYKGKNVQVFLSKNPTSFNESLKTIKSLGCKNLLILLNDRIPDGLDVSWIWDINFEEILTKDYNIALSGDRVYDMAIRLKYASIFVHFDRDYEKVLSKMVENLDSEETLFILANYSAMLDIRKVLTGRKIL